MVITSLEDFIDVLASKVADCIASRDPSLIDQRNPEGLRGRRHIDAVRRRMADERALPPNAKTAFCKGGEYLMTRSAVREELARLSRYAMGEHPEPPVERRKAPASKGGKSPKARERDDLARIKRELETDMRRAREKQ